MKQLFYWTRGISVLICGIFGFGLLIQTTLQFTNTVQVGDTHHSQGQFVQNLSDVPWTLAPAYAATTEEQLEFAISDTPYQPNNTQTDDYHCFVIQPGLSRNVMVTGVNVLPGNKRTVHHAILFKIEGDVKREALERNKATGGKGWTCFGGPDVGGPTGGSNWVGAWAPGAGDGHFPDGVGISLPKDAIIIMQVHYNLSNESGSDHSRVKLNLAPEGKQLTPLNTGLNIAPVELPCADDVKTPNCDRNTIIGQNVAKYGLVANFVPTAMLNACKQNISQYQKPVGDASRLLATCDRTAERDLVLHAVAGHMHLRGKDIKLELNPGTNQTRTLLHIPRWDFHWQGNYWFQTPVRVKRGDIIRISCTFDNSSANQPLIADKVLEPRYVVWGEGTTDEMCLGVTMESNN